MSHTDQVRIKDFRVTEKPWGRELLVDCNSRYAFKRIEMVAGTRSSLQSHRQKLETLFIHDGRILLEIHSADHGVSRREFGPGEAYTIQPGLIHRVEVLEDCVLYEVSTPELDDVVRHADDYHRA
ncbi:MAG: cupin [Magnetococcales bacterium]|nr:cupin [Magnetococcales bacterium]